MTTDLLDGIQQRYYTVTSGASELLDELVQSLNSSPGNETTGNPKDYDYLGDSRRVNNLLPYAKPVPHSGISIKNDWIIGSNKTHITPIECVDQIGEEAKLTPPEMVFGHNQLLFYHKPSGFCYNFLAVEALKGAHFAPSDGDEASDKGIPQQLKVSVAKKTTSSTEDVKELDISYDWTYTTDYKGTLQRILQEPVKERTDSIRVEPTTERIDMAKLQEREPILWFDDVNLFEDELHDHGSSTMSIKVRVMPSGFYVLARYWLRLDHVIVRLIESRVHHLFGTDHLLREYTHKEASFDTLFAQGHPRGMAHYTDINTFQQILPIRHAQYEKIYLK